MDNAERVNEAVNRLKEICNDEGIHPEQGLPESMFLLASCITPIVNVDLFITDKQGRVLMTWRDDKYYGKGWHIPGGCIRIKETIESRIMQVAIEEIGSSVSYDKKAIQVAESFEPDKRDGLEDQLERCHNIAMLYRCYLPDGYIIDNGGINEYVKGYKKWFDHTPEDILPCHLRLYGDFLDSWYKKRKNERKI